MEAEIVVKASKDGNEIGDFQHKKGELGIIVLGAVNGKFFIQWDSDSGRKRWGPYTVEDLFCNTGFKIVGLRKGDRGVYLGEQMTQEELLSDFSRLVNSLIKIRVSRKKEGVYEIKGYVESAMLVSKRHRIKVTLKIRCEFGASKHRSACLMYDLMIHDIPGCPPVIRNLRVRLPRPKSCWLVNPLEKSVPITVSKCT